MTSRCVTAEGSEFAAWLGSAEGRQRCCTAAEYRSRAVWFEAEQIVSRLNYQDKGVGGSAGDAGGEVEEERRRREEE